MIRKNPNGDLPVIHESAFVDPTAILCGKVIVCEKKIAWLLRLRETGR